VPQHALEVLSQLEVERLVQANEEEFYETYRRCSLAVLNTGSDLDNAKDVLERFKAFAIQVIQQERGIKLEIDSAPSSAFVDGEMIVGIQEHLFSVLRDIVYINNELKENRDIDFASSKGISNAVFHIVRNAGLLRTNSEANLVVCWGGHSINSEEYDYTKVVGYELGLRNMDICTGCGPGAMKGPMKGATIAHAKQRSVGRYIGITEPGIIAAESPNPIVNELVIMPDIEKRLEAFVRVGHGIVVFPGGAGTAEEILYILSILMHPKNTDVPFPLIFTGPAASAEYFKQIDNFIGETLGPEAQKKYEIIVDSPADVAKRMKQHMETVQAFRRQAQDAYYFNWVLETPLEVQTPFEPTHKQMAELNLTQEQSPYNLAINLRKAFSGIVAGNVKANGIQAIEQHGPYELSGSSNIMNPLSALLESFVEQKRMKIPTSEYKPCYRLV
jgi:predicted Rossmann-fold nucleotide-binding protein